MYYKLEPSTDIKVIGWSPQVEIGVFPVSLDDDPRSSKSFGFHEADLTKIIFPQPIIHTRAKITDYIPCSFIGTRSMPLVSKFLKELLEDCAYKKVQFIPAVIWHKNLEVHDYFYMNYYNSAFELIDFEHSKVVWSTISKDKRNNQPVAISSLEEFLAIEQELKPPVGLKITPIEFKVIPNVDLFFLRRVRGGWGYYVSERLKGEIERNKFTGMQFRGVNEIW